MTEHSETIPRETILAETLYLAGYTEPRLRQFWGAPVSEALVRNNAAPAIHVCQTTLATETAAEFDRRLAVLALLFHFHREVEDRLIRDALGAEAYDIAVEAGLIVSSETAPAPPVPGTSEPSAADGNVVAPVALVPYNLPVGVPRGFRAGDENLYLVSDHGTLVEPGILDGDFVLGLGGAGRTLVSITPRERVELAADIGTGCGIQALLLARHADRVIATDISHRALHLAGLSARLNGITTIDFRHGSMLEPLDEKVDLLVSNPPFVITPRTSAVTFEYRDAGMSGDWLVRSLFTAIPEVLAPGGRSVCLGNWETTSASDDGPEAWVTDPDTSVLVIERETLDPVAYAETWIRDGGVPRAGEDWNRATAAWMDDFASRDVAQIVFGYVLWSRADNAVSTIASTTSGLPVMDRTGGLRTRVRTTSAAANNPHGLGEFLSTVFALRSWLATAEAAEIADTAFTRSPDLVEHRHFVPGESEPTSITLEQGIGFGQVFDLDTALAGFVSVADGSLTLRQTANALAQLLDVDTVSLEDQLIAQVRALVAEGVLLPATEAPTP